MAGRMRLAERVEVREEVVKKACSLAMKAHNLKSPGKQYLVDKSRSSVEVVISFPGVWSVSDWFCRKPFGEAKINLEKFPSLRNLGTDEVAAVNEAFQLRFERILESLQTEVVKAVKEGKKVVFTGHSSGGPIAILATLWFLENRASQVPPLCVTFGSPLLGDRILPHALGRENWCDCFIHFVARYDIVPRILLAPLSSIEQQLQPVLHSFNPNSPLFKHEVQEASVFYAMVMRSAASVSSHAACNLMGCTNMLLETVTSFIEFSPYRPFGTYVFCTGNGNLVTVKNPDAILQLLFYCSQLTSDAEVAEVARRSLQEHLKYEEELKSLERQKVVPLDHLEKLPLSTSRDADIATINTALNDLGLSMRARLCLQAAGELEQLKRRNQAKIDGNISKVKDGLNIVEGYRAKCEVRRVGYYDTFKLQKDHEDFSINVKRLELAGAFDEIIEMLKRYQLPYEFESRKEWIELGTRYRSVIEPLDIANYYRHAKNEDTGPYLVKGRPRRYRCTQKWLEQAEKFPPGTSKESCFWAEVEELCLKTSEGSFGDGQERVLILERDVEERVLTLERDVLNWVRGGKLGKDVFLEESTFVKWWKRLPSEHRSVFAEAATISTARLT
ncbi:protein EDS1-like [Malania oleifera]|uniref:protein EDS1-like n=1 Tax=Malania oleifera TaxID=397392 RepID=UPI0025AE46C2|nr:protein EDS1-like [Malania oleifera]